MSNVMTGAPGHDLLGHTTPDPLVRQQLPLPLAWNDDAQDEQGAFLVGASNQQAFDHLSRHDQWAMPATLLAGPEGAGKSLLARIFAMASGGDVVDGITALSEEALFHRWNRALDQRKPLLLVCEPTWRIDQLTLPDLRTRLATAPVVTIADPDIDLMIALLDHLLTRRGLNPPPGFSHYVATHIERRYAAIHTAVHAIDALALSTGRAVTVRLAATALGLNTMIQSDGTHDEQVSR